MAVSVDLIGSGRNALSIAELQRMILREQHSEAMVLPYLLKITKTDFAVSLGLPPTFWDGSYDSEGEQKMIRLQDVIHKGAWKKHLLRPQVRTLPSGFTLVHFSLTTVATDYTRFFLYYYSKRYRSLPSESKSILYNGARACAIWESFNEKIHMQEQGIQAFACPWIYERIIAGRRLFDAYPQRIIQINRAAKAYRKSNGKYGYSPEVAHDRRCQAYASLNAQAAQLAAIPPPEPLTPLPTGIPPFLLLEEPSLDTFTEGV